MSNTGRAKGWELSRYRVQESLGDKDGCTCQSSHSDGFCISCSETVLQPTINHIHVKDDGYLLILGDGSARYLSILESLKYLLFGIIPQH